MLNKCKKGTEYGSSVLARLRTVQTDCTDCENCGYFVHGVFPFHVLSAMKVHILLSAHLLFYFKIPVCLCSCDRVGSHVESYLHIPIKQTFIELLLPARHCSRPGGTVQ